MLALSLESISMLKLGKGISPGKEEEKEKGKPKWPATNRKGRLNQINLWISWVAD